VLVESKFVEDRIKHATPLPIVRLVEIEENRDMVADVDCLKSGGGGWWRRSFVVRAGRGVVELRRVRRRVRHGGEAERKQGGKRRAGSSGNLASTTLLY
jgi:hypothetical protein